MDLVLRTAFVFVLILVVTRAVGRRELSSMEPFDLILLVVIGDLVQQGVTQSDYSLTGTTTVVATLAEIRAEARQKSIGSLDDVRFAVLETNGRISFITRDE